MSAWRSLGADVIRTLGFGMVVALVGTSAWACATGGVSLSSTRYASQDLVEADYANLFEFLRDHHRVRVSSSDAGGQLLAIQSRGQNDMLGMGDRMNPPARPEGDAGEGGGLGGGGDDAQAPDRRVIGSAGYVPARLYVDDSEVGSPVSALREIRLDEIESLRILRPSEANLQFGDSDNSGAVAVILKKGD